MAFSLLDFGWALTAIQSLLRMISSHEPRPKQFERDWEETAIVNRYPDPFVDVLMARHALLLWGTSEECVTSRKSLTRPKSPSVCLRSLSILEGEMTCLAV